MFNPWFYLVLAVALVDWFCVWKDRYRVRYATKPLTLIVLIGWFTVCGGWQGAAFIFGVGLVFSLAGDIFLLKGILMARPYFFQFGLVSFLIVQVLYIAGFNRTLPPVTLVGAALFLAVAAVGFLDARHIVGGLRRTPEGSAQQGPVIVYMIALTLMLFSALYTLVRADWPLEHAVLVGLGAALFFASDSILASDAFVRPIRHAEVPITVTYHLAQVAIVSGVLMKFAA